MGHVVRRSGNWQASIRGPDGREKSKTFARKVDAHAWLTSVDHSKLIGAYVDPVAGKVTFKDFAEAWRKVQIHRTGTEISVEQQLRLHVYPIIGDRPIASVRTSDVQSLVHRLSAALAPSTVAVVYGRVVAVFRAAVRDRIIAASPCVDVKLPSNRTPSMLQVLDVAQILAMSKAVPARYQALVIAGAGLGLRPGELFGLAADRVDFLRRTVRVDQQIARREGGGVGLAPLKTPSSYRTVPLPDVVGTALAAHMKEWAVHPDLGVMFTTRGGGPVQQHPWAEVWGTARTKAKLPAWATPHDLRHFYASMLIRSGASVKVIQTRLGHSSAKTTLDVYGHLFPDEEDRTRTAVDAMLRPNPADISRTSTAP